MALLRSYLFVPAGDGRKIQKALGSAADAVILDLEDAVLPERKAAARQALAELLNTPPAPGERPRLFVRANGAGSPWFTADLQTLALPPVAGFVLPKVERAAEVEAAARLLYAAERSLGLPSGHFEILPMIETAHGLQQVGAIAGAPRVSRLIFGALDLANDLGVTWQPDFQQFLYHRSRLAVASRVAGIRPPVDGVWPRIDDLVGLEADCQAARMLGFAGRTLIHPAHIEIANRAFSPTAEELAWARRVLAAADTAAAGGAGVARVDGVMIDRPVIERARRLLES